MPELISTLASDFVQNFLLVQFCASLPFEFQLFFSCFFLCVAFTPCFKIFSLCSKIVVTPRFRVSLSHNCFSYAQQILISFSHCRFSFTSCFAIIMSFCFVVLRTTFSCVMILMCPSKWISSERSAFLNLTHVLRTSF